MMHCMHDTGSHHSVLIKCARRTKGVNTSWVPGNALLQHDEDRQHTNALLLSINAGSCFAK